MDFPSVRYSVHLNNDNKNFTDVRAVPVGGRGPRSLSLGHTGRHGPLCRRAPAGGDPDPVAGVGAAKDHPPHGTTAYAT